MSDGGIAILYSGRLFGRGTSAWDSSIAWADNHLRHLIRPNHASVFVVGSAINWCGAPAAAREAVAAGRLDTAQAIFESEVRAAFQNWPDLHVGFMPLRNDSEKADDERFKHYTHNEYIKLTGLVQHAKGNVAGMRMLSMRWQLRALAFADQLRRRHGSYRLVVRARLDVVLWQTVAFPTHEAHMPPADTILAFGPTCFREDWLVENATNLWDVASPSVTGRWQWQDSVTHELHAMGTKCSRVQLLTNRPPPGGGAQVRMVYSVEGRHDYWSDWVYVAREPAFAAMLELGQTSSILSRNESRCLGLCQEEQMTLQLQARGLKLAPLHSWYASLERVSCIGLAPALDLPQAEEWSSPCGPRAYIKGQPLTGDWPVTDETPNCTVREVR